jgi:hypothetical protein
MKSKFMKNILKVLAAGALTLLAASCSDLVMDLRLTDLTRNVTNPADAGVTLDDSAVIKYYVIDETSKLTDGSEDEYVYNTAVCTAEVDEDTGLLTLKKEGKGSTAVWVRVVNITPEPDEILYRVRYNVNVDGSISADQTGFVQRPYTIEPTTKDHNGNDIENGPLTYESVSSADEDVVTAEINDDGDLVITPQNPGTTEVTVTTENAAGDTVCVVYEVTVEEDGTTTVEIKNVAIPVKITTNYVIQGYEVEDTNIAEAGTSGDFTLVVVPANDGTTYITVYGSTGTVNEENGTDYINDFANKYKITVSGGLATYELISSQFNLYPKKNFTAYQSVSASAKPEESFASSTLANNVITINAAVTDGAVTPVTNAQVTATGKTFYDDDTKITYRVSVGDKGGWSYSIFQVQLDYTKAKGSILRYKWDETLNDGDGDYCWKPELGSYMETADTSKTKSAELSIVRYVYISGLYTLRPVSDGETTVDAAATDAGNVLYTITNNVKISNSCHVIDYNLATTRVLIPFVNLYNSEISKIDLSADGASSTNSNYVFQATSNSVEVECDNNSTVNAVGQTGNVTIVDKDDPSKTATFGTEVITGGIMTYKYPL